MAGLALGVGLGCKGKSSEEVQDFAMRVVTAARSESGIGEELVDAELVEKVRRVQLVRRTMLDTFDHAKLVEVLAGEAGPDRQYPLAERPRKQRERATRGLVSVIDGPCRAYRDKPGAEAHVARMVKPIDGQPPEVTQAMADLDRALSGVDGAVLKCETGKVAVIVHADRDGKLKLVDLFDLQRMPIEINPNDPTMK